MPCFIAALAGRDAGPDRTRRERCRCSVSIAPRSAAPGKPREVGMPPSAVSASTTFKSAPSTPMTTARVSLARDDSEPQAPPISASTNAKTAVTGRA